MKKLLVLLFTATVFSWGMKAQTTYMITGSLENQGNEKITLTYFDGVKNVEIATQAVDGKFSLSGPAPIEPVVARLNTSVDRNIYLGEQKASMFIPAAPLELVLSENCDLTISGNALDLNLATVECDRYNEGFNKLRVTEEQNIRKTRELQNDFSEAKKMGITDGLNDIGQRMSEVRTQSIALRKKFVIENPDEFVSVWLLSISMKEYSLDELKAAYQSLAENLKHTSFGKMVAGRIVVIPMLEDQKTAPTSSKPESK